MLPRGFRQRRFVLASDGNYGSHEMARFACRRHGRPDPVSTFYPDAQLYAPPTAVLRPRPAACQGRQGSSPQQVVAVARRTPRHVAWYGGGRRDVAIASGTGQWCRAGEGLVAVRWVFVQDRTGTHRDASRVTTDVAMSARAVIAAYVGRRSEETTSHEMRSYLGLEATRGGKEKAVRRATPCPFGLYAVAAALDSRLPRRCAQVRGVDRAGRQDVTCWGARTAVRRWLWPE